MILEDMESGPHLVFLNKSVLAKWFPSFTPKISLWGWQWPLIQKVLEYHWFSQNDFSSKGRSSHSSIITRMLLVLLGLVVTFPIVGKITTRIMKDLHAHLKNWTWMVFCERDKLCLDLFILGRQCYDDDDCYYFIHSSPQPLPHFPASQSHPLPRVYVYVYVYISMHIHTHSYTHVQIQ